MSIGRDRSLGGNGSALLMASSQLPLALVGTGGGTPNVDRVDATLAKPAVWAVVGSRGCEKDRLPLTLALSTPPIPADLNIRNGFPSTASSNASAPVLSTFVLSCGSSRVVAVVEPSGRPFPLSTSEMYASLAAGVMLSMISPMDSVSSLKFLRSVFGDDFDVENLNENFFLLGELGVFGELLSIISS